MLVSSRSPTTSGSGGAEANALADAATADALTTAGVSRLCQSAVPPDAGTKPGLLLYFARPRYPCATIGIEYTYACCSRFGSVRLTTAYTVFLSLPANAAVIRL